MDLRDLYAAPLETFTGARKELVAELERAGRNEEAAAVKKLRKPTLVVWALNQLAGLDPDGLEELSEAGVELRSGDTATIRAGSDRRKKAVARLTDVARGALEGAGKSTSQLDRVAHALLFVATSEEATSDLRAGILASEPEASSVDDLGWSLDTLDDAAPTVDTRAQRASEKAEALEVEARALEEEAKQLEKEADAIELSAERARATATKARAEADSARKKAERARSKAT